MNTTTKSWTLRLASYKATSNQRAIAELAVTLAALSVSWVICWLTFTQTHWLFALLPAIVTGSLLVRVFILQHDCGHGSLFTSTRANNFVGRFLAVLTMTPYESWRDAHARHHASSGNLNKRGFGDIDTMTVQEYRNSSRFQRLRYRAYRHPVVMFGLGPSYLFLFRHRLPIGTMKTSRLIWIDTLVCNLGILLTAFLLIYVVGIKAFLFIQISSVVIGASIGVWMFYVQHQFEPTYWEHNDNWNRENAALHGSSFYDLPKPLMWISGNVGIHHVHHLSSRIPFHRLPEVLRDFPELKTVGRVTFFESLQTIRLVLWDEQLKRLISFRELSAHAT